MSNSDLNDLYAEIDRLRRRIKVLEAERDICGQTQTLHTECRIWQNHDGLVYSVGARDKSRTKPVE